MKVYQWKVVLMGDEKAGKSSILRRFLSDTFDAKEASTEVVDFCRKTVLTNAITENQPALSSKFDLHLWDCSGNPKWTEDALHHVQHADAVLLVYDLTSRRSQANAIHLLSEICDRGIALAVLVGNKTDLLESNPIEADLVPHSNWPQTNVTYAEVSAANGEGIPALFNSLVENLTQATAHKWNVSPLVPEARESDGSAEACMAWLDLEATSATFELDYGPMDWWKPTWFRKRSEFNPLGGFVAKQRRATRQTAGDPLLDCVALRLRDALGLLSQRQTEYYRAYLRDTSEKEDCCIL
jgi:small GTP-binding protein